MRWWRVFRVEFLLSTGVHQKNFPIFFVGQPIGNRRPGVAPASLRGSMYSNNFGTHDRMAQIPRDGCTVQCKCDFQSINNKTRTAFRFFFFYFCSEGAASAVVCRRAAAPFGAGCTRHGVFLLFCSCRCCFLFLLMERRGRP